MHGKLEMSQLPFISSATRPLHINIWNLSARSHHTHSHSREREREMEEDVCAIFYTLCTCKHTCIYIYVHILSRLRSVYACGRDMFYNTSIKPKTASVSAYVHTVHVYFCLQ